MNGKAKSDDVLRSLDSMLSRMKGVKRKLGTFADEEARLYRHEAARVHHLGELYSIHSPEDIKYDAWSRMRLDRLLVDYLLRMGYGTSARMLAEERGIGDLVDVETFETMARIRDKLLAGSVTEALAWCTAGDIKKELRKMEVSCYPLTDPGQALYPGLCPVNAPPYPHAMMCSPATQSNLEFMLRYQQYIELVRSGTPAKKAEAIKHAQKYLQPYRTSHRREVQQASALLAMTPKLAASCPAYSHLYSPSRWETLADLFTEAHNTLLALPRIPLLHMALSSGLSALKTPACHSSHPASAAAPSHSTSLSLATSVCPICSTELNELARAVPYAHHTQSHVEHDLLLLPNGRVYGKTQLEDYSSKAGLLEGQVKDLRTGEVFGGDRLKKVFIT